MKKIFLLSLITLSFAISCQKNGIIEKPDTTPTNLREITVGVVTNQNDDTKTSISSNDNIWDIKWTTGDKLGGLSYTPNDPGTWDATLYTFDMTTDLSGGDSDNVVFTGKVNTEKELVRFIYPHREGGKSNGGFTYFSLNEQTIDMNAPLANLDNYLYMVSDEAKPTSAESIENVTMKHITSVLDFKIKVTKVSPKTTINKLTIEGMEGARLTTRIEYKLAEVFATENTVSGTTLRYADASSTYSGNIEVSLENPQELQVNTTYDFPVAIFPMRIKGGSPDAISIKIEYSVDGEPQEKTFIKNGKSRYFDILRGDVQPISLECDLSPVELPDFTDPAGTFFLFEGNMTDSWGKLVYIDKDGGEWKDIFSKQNGGKSIGNVLQDMYIYQDRIYFLTQNGNLLGHGGAPSDKAYGRLVVCDAKTMKVIYVDQLEYDSEGGDPTWPQHLVVANDKIYIQYSEHMEDNSGVYVLNIGDDAVTFDSYVADTFGEFTVSGATKARMTLSNDKIFMGRGNSFISIDTQTDAVTEIASFENKQVKDVVKGSDGNLYVAVSGEGTKEGSQEEGWVNIMTSEASIVCYNYEGVEQSTTAIKVGDSGFDAIGFPIDPPSPNVGMCASFTSPTIYFRDQPKFGCATVGSIADYGFGMWFTSNLLGPSGTSSDPIYGYMGEHTTGTLYVGLSTNSYTTGTIYAYTSDGYGTYTIAHTYNYSDSDHASPAGIDFAYRFTEEWINK